MMPGMGPWIMVLWALVALAVLVLAVLAAIWLARSLIAGSGKADGAEDVLRRRYAAGEITREEYLRLYGDLHPK